MVNNKFEVQNWRISREIAVKLAQSKNLAMLHWRMKNNLSQEKAALRCNLISPFGNPESHIWSGLENHRIIPTHEEAKLISETIGLPQYFLFPQLRVRLTKNIFVRATAKLTFVRLVRGLTMKDLAKMANVPFLFISELERGFEANTNFMDYVLKICDALNEHKKVADEYYTKVEPQDIVGDIPDDFFINYETMEQAVVEEYKKSKKKII